MPPIDPLILRDRAASVADPFPEALGVASKVRAVLDDYADRLHRMSPRLTSRAVDNAYRAPPPVARAIVAALREVILAHPLPALSVLHAIWAGGSREERRIAAELLGHIITTIPSEALGLIELWLPTLNSTEAADALADLGLGPLLRADPRYIVHLQRWIGHKRKWARRFSVAALWPLIQLPEWDNLPAALEVIRPVMADPDAEVRHITADVLKGLAAKTPREVACFLREQATRPNHHAHWVVRAAMLALPPADQADITRALRI
jgi:hypothetical protein